MIFGPSGNVLVVIERPLFLPVSAIFFPEATMKAIRIHKYGDASTLQLEEAPTLTIQFDQLLVRIRDAGVNP
jgi:hypothetical protein